MGSDDRLARLTPRQLQILDLLDRGAPLKLIASELDISTTRVNQLVRELKERLRAQSKFQLVQIYRESSGVRLAYTKHAYPESELPVDELSSNLVTGTAVGEFVFSDVQSFTVEAPWQEQMADPRVVPEMLDGPHANLRRLIAMVFLLILIVVAITFLGVATLTVTEFWSNYGSISSETQGPAK